MWSGNHKHRKPEWVLAHELQTGKTVIRWSRRAIQTPRGEMVEISFWYD